MGKIVRDAQGTYELSIEGGELEDRLLWIDGEITAELATRFIRKLRSILKDGKDLITVGINSAGGEVQAGLAIFDAIQGCGATVRTVGVGMAYSMGALILSGGTKGHRFMLPNSKAMVHEPLMLGGGGGSATAIGQQAESILETRRVLNGILAETTGKSIKAINKVTDHDQFFTAEQAVEFGLVDEVKQLSEVIPC